MKMSPTPPNVKDNGMYRTSEAIKELGMDRTTFWRLANSGKIKRRLHKIDGKWRYSGKELLRVYNAYL